MTYRQAWRWLVPLLVLMAFATGWICGQAHADDEAVQVNASYDEAYRIQQRLEAQVRDGDEISVMVTTATEKDLLGTYLNNHRPGSVLVLVIGEEVYVRANDWVPQQFLDDTLDRIDNVTHRPIDQVVRVISEVHKWQDKNHRPTPPPPPPPPPGPPPPPPEPFHMPWYGWTGIGIGSLFIIWLPLEIRRRRRIAAISRRAQEQMDWGLDKYGIKTSLD